MSTETSDTVSYELGNKTFTLDRSKAEEAYASKKVINGRDTMYFNILPLKYNWAYELYKNMKAKVYFILKECRVMMNITAF